LALVPSTLVLGSSPGTSVSFGYELLRFMQTTVQKARQLRSNLVLLTFRSGALTHVQLFRLGSSCASPRTVYRARHDGICTVLVLLY
jgi:hypothetical protein